MKTFRLSLISLAILLFAVGSATAQSPSTGRSLHFEGVDGPRRAARALERLVGQQLEQLEAMDVADRRATRRELRKHKLRPRTDMDYEAAAKALESSGFISGRVSGRRPWKLVMRVRNGADGRIVAEETWSARRAGKLTQAVRATFLERIGPSLQQIESPQAQEARLALQAQARAEAARASAEAPPGLDAEPEEGTARRALFLDASVGLRVFNRSYGYDDNIDGLASYDLGLAGAAAVAFDAYPFALIDPTSPLTMLGVTAGFDYALGLNSELDGGNIDYPTQSLGWFAGLKGRLPIDEHEATVLVAFGSRDFSIDDAEDGTPKPLVPDVSYRQLQIGVGGRLALLERLSVYADLAYLLVLSTGELSADEYFPNAGGWGFSAEVGAAFAIVHGLEARLSLFMEYYGLGLDPEPDGVWQVDGGSDRYLGGVLSAAYRWRE